MSDPVTVENRADIAVLTIDNPPVNALTAGVAEALVRAVRRAVEDPAVRALVLRCAGRTFIAGADLNELERAAWDEAAPLPDLHPLLARLEECPKPVVAAVHGTALGGGVEVAMAGHYRIAAADARLGLPEITLGLIPGAGGTQRLPRLVGVSAAIDMILSGRPISAVDALRAGLIDRMAEGDLEPAAVVFAREVAERPIVRTRDRREKLSPPDLEALLAAGRDTARRTRRHQPAALAAIDAVEAACRLSFEEGCRRERELAEACVRSEPCRALIHAFFAERAVTRVPGVPPPPPPGSFARVGIIGAGTMGGGIAMACANAGLEVLIVDASKEALGRGLDTIRRNYESSVDRGRLSAADRDQRLARIRGRVGVGELETADVVIEAVFENLALKRQVFAELDAAAGPGALLATNTSTLDIDAIAAATRRPSSVVGLHFFSPAHVMRLVEIVRGAATSPDTVARGLAFARRLGKVGVVVRNGPGFVGNRMMFPYMYEAQFLVEDGATPAQVDHALTDWGMAMGIFAVDDLGGLDVAWRVRQELKPFEDPRLRKPLVADRLCEMGRFGQKTGAGWYRYRPGDRAPIPDPDVLQLIERVAAEAGIVRRPFTDEEIRERTIYALINEGAKVLDEGLALRASDIDVLYITGYGFPAYRGGPMFYADRVGLARILERVQAFHREHGERWRPAPLLERLARSGRTFRELDLERAAELAGEAAGPVRG